MVIISILYIIWIIYSIYWWLNIYKKHKNLFWFFFLLFTLFSALWFLLYYSFLSWINNTDYLLIISRICFTIWIMSSYSLLLSIYFIKKWSIELNILSKILIFIFIIVISTVFNFTDLIIKKIEFFEIIWEYREIYWDLISINVILQLVFIFSFIYISLKNFKELSIINKIRTKYILIFSYIFLITMIVLQSILPVYNIWFFDKYLIVNYILYIFSINYILKRFYFSDIWYSVLKILIIIISLVWSNLLNYFSYYYLEKSWLTLNVNFLNSYFLNHIFLILSFYIIYNLLNKYIFWLNNKNEIKNSLDLLEYEISKINNLEKINSLIQSTFSKIFKISYSKITKINKKNSQNKNLKKLFENSNYELLINDKIFFLEKNINYELFQESINKNSYLIFPIYDDDKKLSAFLSLWNKNLWEYFNKYEINIIKKFSFFLENHIKYINSYLKLRKLTLNLDKEVDKKTIEYNNLINKQKEYISIISHEIKSPVSSAIFQTDLIISDIEKLDKNSIKEELNILNNVLIRIWELTNKLFNIEYFEKKDVTLFKQKTNISNFISEEFEYYKNIYPLIEFRDNISPLIWYYKIDRIQFKQVIQNLINNAVKFTSQKNWIILFSLINKKEKIEISIEDNWIWLNWVDVKKIFDRYSTSKENNIWLWMWLYLCKKIIELHWWKINAQKSKILSWAKFKIELDKKNLD